MGDDLWGHTHGANAASKQVSPFGKRKWRDYRRGGQDVPADLGGVRLCITESVFQDLEDLTNAARFCSPSDGYDGESTMQEVERRFFQELLESPSKEAGAILEQFIANCRASDTSHVSGKSSHMSKKFARSLRTHESACTASFQLSAGGEEMEVEQDAIESEGDGSMQREASDFRVSGL